MTIRPAIYTSHRLYRGICSSYQLILFIFVCLFIDACAEDNASDSLDAIVADAKPTDSGRLDDANGAPDAYIRAVCERCDLSIMLPTVVRNSNPAMSYS